MGPFLLQEAKSIPTEEFHLGNQVVGGVNVGDSVSTAGAPTNQQGAAASKKQ